MFALYDFVSMQPTEVHPTNFQACLLYPGLVFMRQSMQTETKLRGHTHTQKKSNHYPPGLLNQLP